MFAVAVQIAVSCLFTNRVDRGLLSFFYFFYNAILAALAVQIAYCWRRLFTRRRRPSEHLGWLCIVLLSVHPLVFQINAFWVRDIDSVLGQTLSVVAWVNTAVLFTCAMLVSVDIFGALGGRAFVFEPLSMTNDESTLEYTNETHVAEAQEFELSSLIRSAPLVRFAADANKDN